MITLSTGEKLEHSVYGQIELTGFRSVGDEIEITDVGAEETVLDPVLTVQSNEVEFIDNSGSQHVEPLLDFYKHALK